MILRKPFKKAGAEKYAILCACLFLCSCAPVQTPVFLATENIRVSALGLHHSVINAELKFYNPNKQKLQLRSGDVNVYIEQRLLGKARFDTLLNLQPLDTFYIPINGSISMTDVLLNAAKLLFKDSVDITLAGTVRAGMKGFFTYVPVNYKGRLSVDQFLRDSTMLKGFYN